MKIEIFLLVSANVLVISAEVPPPYPARNLLLPSQKLHSAPFRPFPPKEFISLSLQSSYLPSREYGPPSRHNGAGFRRFQGEFFNSPIRPHSVYGPPQRQRENTWKILNHQVSSPQISYDAPSKQIVPFVNSPQTTYGTPQKQIDNVKQNFIKSQNIQVKLPQTSYGAPDPNNVETLERFQAIRQQRLPLKEWNNFRSQDDQKEQQYLPIKNAIDFRNNPNWNQNIAGNNLDLPLPVLNSNVEVQKLDIRTLYPPLGDDDGDKQLFKTKSTNVETNPYAGVTTTTTTTPQPIQSTQNPFVQDEDKRATSRDPAKDAGEPPNVAIATAVAGRPAGEQQKQQQQFYLLQPDGRLQRVVYQKTRQDGDADNEYTVDYRFQNVQEDPNLVYAPLINVG